jgi:hypothetical protein
MTSAHGKTYQKKFLGAFIVSFLVYSYFLTYYFFCFNKQVGKMFLSRSSVPTRKALQTRHGFVFQF